MDFSRYFKDERMQKTLQNKKEKCIEGCHEWTAPFCAPSGLMKECSVCHISKSTNSPLNPENWLNIPDEKRDLWVNERRAALRSK